MSILSKSILAALAVTALSSGAAFADNVVTRIDHPNGPATYVAGPEHGRGFVDRGGGVTIGVFAGDRSFGARVEPGMYDASGRTLIPIHHGRGQVDYMAVAR